MGFVVLQNMSSNKMMLLCYYGGAIVNGMNNSITYNGGSIVVLNASLDMSLPEFKKVTCGRTRWNYNDVEVDIFWRMLARERPIQNLQLTQHSYQKLWREKFQVCMAMHTSIMSSNLVTIKMREDYHRLDSEFVASVISTFLTIDISVKISAIKAAINTL
jgi:hypothetical protein